MTKNPIKPLELDPVTIGDERADRDVVLTSVAVQQGLEGCQQRHEQGDPVPLAQRLERLRQRRGQSQDVPGTPEGLYGWTRMVRGQLQRGHSSKLLLPVGQAACPAPLPAATAAASGQNPHTVSRVQGVAMAVQS